MLNLGSRSTGCQVWGMWQYKVQQGHAISLAQPTAVHSIDNCVVLVSTTGLQRQQGLLVISVVFPGLAAGDQGKQWWRLEPVVYTHTHIWLQSAAGAFVVAGPLVNIHILIGPGQAASTGANYRLTDNWGGPVSVLSYGCPPLCWVHNAVEVSDGDGMGTCRCIAGVASCR